MTNHPMLILTIKDASWAEPIVQRVRTADLVKTYRTNELRASYHLSVNSYLHIVHEDGSNERFRVWDSYTVEVVLDDGSFEDDIHPTTKEPPVLRDDLEPSDDQIGPPDGITGASPR